MDLCERANAPFDQSLEIVRCIGVRKMHRKVAELRADSHELAEALQAKIADIVDVCWARIVAGGSSETRH
jgi:hypothetical protein